MYSERSIHHSSAHSATSERSTCWKRRSSATCAIGEQYSRNFFSLSVSFSILGFHVNLMFLYLYFCIINSHFFVIINEKYEILLCFEHYTISQIFMNGIGTLTVYKITWVPKLFSIRMSFAYNIIGITASIPMISRDNVSYLLNRYTCLREFLGLTWTVDFNFFYSYYFNNKTSGLWQYSM